MCKFIPVHPCDREGKAGCEQTCVKKGDEAVCKCGEGYKLAEDGKKCEKCKWKIDIHGNFDITKSQLVNAGYVHNLTQIDVVS